MTSYLLDPSAFRQAQLSTAAGLRIRELGKAESIAVCAAAMLEMLAGARHQREWMTMVAAFDGLRRVELTDPMAAVELQGTLARQGRHRVSVVEVLVAATAAEHGLTVLHYDHDVERLIDATGGKHEWITEPS
jgi:predicted nucleic acid-binding protein